MPEISVVLVEPLYDGNVGFTARVMKNFGFTRLVLVNPCSLGDDAIMRASHARDVLEGARRMTIDEVYREFDFVVAKPLPRGRHPLLRTCEPAPWDLSPREPRRDGVALPAYR
ncbi:MAG: RNA methyltransferase [Methanoculleus marisnigri]|uniref:RNA methyltransferase n=1 Tax=Methanoculleus marisnigri TaxID=2198 RepID=A0A124G3Y5_9EURY|nr:MAG: RNA methyltransferase [Methanoculleus marisnigri]